jgi:cell division initiation protein
MRIAPIDIAHKSFHRKMMGFDPDEVMDYMRLVSEELEALIRERNSMREQMREKEMQIAEYRERDELLKSTITTAQRMSEKIQVDAERESKLILHDANQKAEMIVRESRDSLKRIYNEINELKKVRMQFENNMKALIHSHLTMLDQAQKIMPNPSYDQQAAGFATAPSQHQSEDDLIKSRVTESIAKKFNVDL